MRRTAAALAICLASATSAFAQMPCYAENDGNNFNNNVSTSGNILLGVKFTPPVSLLPISAQIFTGETTGAATLGIWSHNAAANQPLADLGTGNYNVVSTNSWQGASFPAAIPLTGGTTYWLVMRTPPGGGQTPVDVASATAIVQQYRASTNNGSSWTGPFMFPDRPWKFRFFCNPGYQLNQACASLDINGVQAAPQSPAVTIVLPNQIATASANGLAGQPFDMAVTFGASIVPNWLVTANGQIVNIDLSHPSTLFLFGLGFSTPFVPFTAPVSLPTPMFSVQGQLVVVTPTLPDGFCLSQASEIRTL